MSMMRRFLPWLGASIAALWMQVPVAGQFFAIAMALDIATGILLAGRRGLWSSRGMSPGLRAKAGESLLIGGLFLIESYTHAPLGSGVAGWFAFRELGSSLENLSMLGVRLPPWLERAIVRAEGSQQLPPSTPGSTNEHQSSNIAQTTEPTETSDR